MVVTYIASKTFRQIIDHTINEQGHIVINGQVSNNFDFTRYVKNNISVGFSGIDYIVIDLSALVDDEEQIIDSLKAFRTLHEKIRCIIVAPYYQAGDPLLAELFALGIYNLIASNDFLELKQRLETCLSNEGMSFKDAVDFKEIKDKNGQTEKKIREVNKVMIGLVGSQARIGVTHNALILGNTLRKKGYIVGVIEMNNTGAFEQFMDDFGVKLHDHLYFNLNGIDYYPGADRLIMKTVMEKSYNFLILDFGNYRDCDIEYFHRHCHVKIVISGSKAWELPYLVDFLSKYGDDAKRHMSVYFNFTDAAYTKALKKSFKISSGHPIDTHFIPYISDPFNAFDYPDVNELLVDYLPEIEGRKKGFLGFGWKKNVNKAAIF
ncbi:MAG: hypothetical protein KH230_09745 [Enterocloster asparagiformis]|nr:hypothetical protein [Enterocloster asparagiformis]